MFFMTFMVIFSETFRMRRLTIAAALLFLPHVADASPLSLPQLDGAAPIFVVISAAEVNAANINGRFYSTNQAKDWLLQAKEKFGGDGPILILCGTDTPIGTIELWQQLVKQTHQHTWTVVKNSSGEFRVMQINAAPVSDPAVIRQLNSKLDSIPKTRSSLSGPSILVPPPHPPTGAANVYKGNDFIIPPPPELIKELQEPE